jgi:hypothetical protein
MLRTSATPARAVAAGGEPHSVAETPCAGPRKAQSAELASDTLSTHAIGPRSRSNPCDPGSNHLQIHVIAPALSTLGRPRYRAGRIDTSLFGELGSRRELSGDAVLSAGAARGKPRDRASHCLSKLSRGR